MFSLRSIKSKLIAIFVVMKVVPLILLALIAWAAAQRLGDTVTEGASALADRSLAVVKEIGAEASSDAIRALDERARQSIERLTTDTAAAVAAFLYDRDKDVLAAADLAPDEAVYSRFLQHRTRTLIDHGQWRLKADESGWEPVKPLVVEHLAADPSLALGDNNRSFNARPPRPVDVQSDAPLFVEMTFVDLDGRERIKINGDGRRGTLNDITRQENTFVKAEKYWPALSKLKPGDIYVSDVIGAYVGSRVIGPYTPASAKKAGIAYEPEASAYAGMENPVGQRFKGIVRWATPVERGGEIVGYVTLALDHDHIRQFTDRIVPTDRRYTSINNAADGNYAFMWDHEARAISHPRDYFIPGFDPATGKRVAPWLDKDTYAQWQASGEDIETFLTHMLPFDEQSLSKKPSVDMIKAGTVALDCRYLNFSPQCAGWVQLTENGGSGSFLIFFSGLWKLTTAAAIPYYTGQYGASGTGFGFVTIGANVDEFHSAATESADRIGRMVEDKRVLFERQRGFILDSIQKNLHRTASELGMSTLVMVIVVIAVAIWMARFMTRRITDINSGIGQFTAGDLGYRLKVKSRDEMGQLSVSLNHMADAVQESFARSEDARRRAEEANQLKSDFIASISHELRTPLNGIMGFAELLELELNDPVKRDCATTIKNSGAHLLSVVNDLLDLAKIEAGRMELRRETLELKPFLERSFESHRAHGQAKGLKMRLELDDALPGSIEIDEQRLRQIINNLLNNAIKFSDEGEVAMCALRKGDHLVIDVHDSGCGIAEDDLDAIFEKFRQVDQFLTRAQGGTGLGLALAREFAQMLGGDITVRSVPGEGSTFTLTIPLTSQ
ncbi:sensor histidine kinase [Nitrogeniibacter aestuarii]|uniref:sensor histidine kinase n=1 Tax=Nitrogeniibacter aestuarii TaxID=2815343 RepID=UPI002ED93A8E